MIRHDEVGPSADDEVLAEPNSPGVQAVHLLDQRPRVHHHPVADDAQGATVENSRGDEVKYEGAPIVDHGVSGVGPPLIADHHIGVPGEEVHDLALAFVAPLCAEYDQSRHGSELSALVMS